MRWGPYDLFADYHTHTHHSHGSGTVLENVRAARERGLETVAISEHGPANLFGVGVEGFHIFDVIRKEVKEAQEMYPELKVLVGVEANVVSEDGDLDIPPYELERFDVVLVGLHPLVRWRDRSAGWRLVAQNVAAPYVPALRDEVRAKNTRAIVNAVLCNPVHAVTHPGYRLPIDTRELARACARVGCAMEISASHQHTTMEYIRIAKDEGARFMLGSDAHSPSRVGDLGRAALLARRAGLEAGDIVNARPLHKGTPPGAKNFKRQRS